MEEAIAAYTQLSVIDRLSFGHDYATTLACWRERFLLGAADVGRLGFDETFRRMWSFSLAYSEAGFRSEYLNVVQLLLARPD
jgi:cyclopropane-fatty-acyl-phospholipid synthase